MSITTPISIDFKEELIKLRKKFLICSPLMITMGDSMRQKILMILAEAGVNGMNVADITAKTQLSRPAISHHLKILKDSGMIVNHKKGTQVYYFICIRNALSDLRDLLNTIDGIVSDIDMESVREKAPWMLNEEEE